MHDERIHACLDGTLPRESLSTEERHRLEAMEAVLVDATSALRSAPVPDLTDRVMGSLPLVAAAPAAATEGWLARATRWLWSPISIAVRPAYAFAGVAVVVTALLLMPPASSVPGGAPVAASPHSDSRLYVQFRIELPEASEVALAGTFTGWEPEHELTEISPGVWSAMVPLSPGVHDYTFIVDGTRMVVDPYAPRVADSFGGSNSRLFLPAPNENA